MRVTIKPMCIIKICQTIKWLHHVRTMYMYKKPKFFSEAYAKLRQILLLYNWLVGWLVLNVTFSDISANSI